MCLVYVAVLVRATEPITAFSTKVTANGKSFAVTGVKVDLKDPRVAVKVGLAQGCVGRTEALAGMAKRNGAVAAINGSFFDAYTSAELKNPDMSLISKGQLIFKSNIGSVLGFGAENTPVIFTPRYRLSGTLTHENGRTESWFVYWINRKPTAASCVTMFTRHWGATVGAAGGTLVVVKDGVVDDIAAGTTAIPNNGYVIQVIGEAGLLRRFRVGDKIAFTPETSLVGAGDGAGVQEGIGAGPRVLVNGAPVFNPTAEGFNDPKILTRAGARSAAGFSADRVLLLVTVKSARVSDMGHILKALGCVEGMNLDGGASSGLWANGKYLTTPGREISNALLVLRK
jgi:exopolysaccharide biosynthesis protein